MSNHTPVPQIRQPTPSGRGGPRLGLAIPGAGGSPSSQPTSHIPGATAPPPLRLNTPNATIGLPRRPSRPALSLAPFGAVSNAPSNPSGSTPSIDSQTDAGYNSSDAASNVSLPLRGQDPASATSGASPSTENSMSLKELEAHLEDIKKGLDGREPDVLDLDDDGWKAVSSAGKIIELGSLGEGAGGAVTKCKLKDGKKMFALKIITTTPDPDIKKQIYRELSYNRSCKSDYICQYYGFFDDSSGAISIAMEYCEGGSLDAIYKELQKLGGRAGVKVLGKVAEGVLQGLNYLNSLSIIHRDIKPSNILLTRDGQVKLCDFGVSGEAGTKGDANTFIGTSAYMAPERITGQRYKINSDVWSLGVTLLEVAQHRFPFPADGTEMQPKAGLIDLLTYIVRQPTPELKDEPDNNLFWPDAMKQFIAKSLIKDAEQRPDPQKMLAEPWIEETIKKNVNMVSFLRKVWNWKE